MAQNYYYYIDAVGEQSASPMTAEAIATLVKSRVTAFTVCASECSTFPPEYWQK